MKIRYYYESMYICIVENLQIGRIDDCMKHYSILQANLISLATELDNFPAGSFDPYKKVTEFPDLIMRKDICDDLQPLGTFTYKYIYIIYIAIIYHL